MHAAELKQPLSRQLLLTHAIVTHCGHVQVGLRKCLQNGSSAFMAYTNWAAVQGWSVVFGAMSLHDAGGGAYQTLLKRVAAPGYPTRPDIAVHAVTIQVPLEGSLLTGGVAFVLKTGQQQWLACRAEGVLRSDFFISTQQVCSIHAVVPLCKGSNKQHVWAGPVLPLQKSLWRASL